MAYISATDQAISPRDKFLPLPLSRIIECDLKEREGIKEKKNRTTTTFTTTHVTVGELTTLTGEAEEEKEEEKQSKEGEGKVDERKRPDGDADGQGQLPVPGDVQVPSHNKAVRDGPYKMPSIISEDENPVFLGLKVYTKKEAVVAIGGRVLDGQENEDEDEWEDEGEGGDGGDEDEDE